MTIDITEFQEKLRHVLGNSEHGIVGLVDDLLTLAVQRDVHLSWQAGLCRVKFLVGMEEHQIDVPMPKSIFRAAVARVAALCNERNPNSVSPYGGKGELATQAANRRKEFRLVIHVSFVNTPETQSLSLDPLYVERVADFVSSFHGPTESIVKP